MKTKMFEIKPSLLWLGAGRAEHPSVDFDDYEKVILVEPEAKDYKYLLQKFGGGNKFFVKQQALDLKDDCVLFNTSIDGLRYTDQEISTFLKRTYKEIIITELYKVDKLDIENLFYELFVSDFDIIFEVPCLNPLLNLRRIISDVDINNFRGLYVNIGLDIVVDFDLRVIIDELAQSGFKLLSCKSNQSIIEAYFLRDKLKGSDDNRHSQLQNQLGRCNESLEELRLDISNLYNSKNELLKEVKFLGDSFNDELANLIISINKTVNDLSVKLDFIDSKINDLCQIDALSELSDSLASKIKNHINLVDLNNKNQIENFVNLMFYLSANVRPLFMHGWPISSDLALYIVKLIDEKKYTHIVEMGSGSSTLVMAHALEKQKKIEHEVVIQSLEHSELYLEQTRSSVKSQNLSSFVKLIHAPLKRTTLHGEDYSFYVMDELSFFCQSELLDILVLIDGPPGATNKKARYPAVPLILSKLADIDKRIRITFLLDDCRRDEEKQIFSDWSRLEIFPFLNVEKNYINNEKGLGLLVFENGVEK